LRNDVDCIPGRSVPTATSAPYSAAMTDCELAADAARIKPE